MDIRFLLAAVLLPIVLGAAVPLWKPLGQKAMVFYVGAVTLLTSGLAWGLILTAPEEALHLVALTDRLVLTLRFDSLGRFFAGIIATLWPLTILYAAEYMEHEEGNYTFFAFFTMTYGITLGVAMAGNLFTMYSFYELLTLSTVPLVLQPGTRAATRAAQTYLAFSLSGAAFGFASIMYLIGLGGSGLFAPGGVLTNPGAADPRLLQIFYLVGFLGFGVKSAIFPMDRWLPKASVAPTPVTALLHAVAVVKSGVFALMRLTYFAFGTALLRGTWVQNVVMGFAVFTVFYGAVRAVKETHWKRRLAYSTVANLSYILFGVTVMTGASLTAALLHMAVHAEIKILAFFCAGAVLHGTGRQYLRELDGLGRKMPLTFGCFAVSALALTGIPPFAGFVSKWHLLTAAAQSENPLAYLGAAVLLAAALLTAIYMLPPLVRAFFPRQGYDAASLEQVHEVGPRMTVPMAALALGILLTGLFAQRIVSAAQAIAGALG